MPPTRTTDCWSSAIAALTATRKRIGLLLEKVFPRQATIHDGCATRAGHRGWAVDAVTAPYPSHSQALSPSSVSLVVDAMTDLDANKHRHSVEKIFPRLGETATTDNALKLLKEADANGSSG